jgi:uncharacterized OB-fold protein
MTGWVCPRCGAVYSLLVHECWRCNLFVLKSVGSSTTSEEIDETSGEIDET